ncbi:hypothetical protein [Chryseobacterium sp.]|uniref:hypothetical protein n=1 Tax=Chryseobacterium sp. TaxID=1871047 RepID=UPI00388ECC1C
MKFNIFKIFVKKEAKSIDNDLDVSEIEDCSYSKYEELEYNERVDFFMSNLINSLILFTYNSKELMNLESVLIDPLTELYEELDYAFIEVCFETIFRNNLIDPIFKPELLEFKNQVDQIQNEIWDYHNIDEHEDWKLIKATAEDLLTRIGIDTREFNANFHPIIKVK